MAPRRSTRKASAQEVAPAAPSSSKKLTKKEKEERRASAREAMAPPKKPPVADEEPEVPVKPKQPRKRKDAPTKKAAPKQAAKKSKAAPTVKKSEIALQDVPAEDVVEVKPRKRTPAKPATAKTPSTTSSKKSRTAPKDVSVLSPVPENKEKEAKTMVFLEGKEKTAPSKEEQVFDFSAMPELQASNYQDDDLWDDGDDDDSPPGLQPSKHNNDDDDDDDKSKASVCSFISARSTATTSTTTSRRTTAKKGKKNEWGIDQNSYCKDLVEGGQLERSDLKNKFKIRALQKDHARIWGPKNSKDFNLFSKNLSRFFKIYYPEDEDAKPRAVPGTPARKEKVAFESPTSTPVAVKPKSYAEWTTESARKERKIREIEEERKETKTILQPHMKTLQNLSEADVTAEKASLVRDEAALVRDEAARSRQQDRKGAYAAVNNFTSHELSLIQKKHQLLREKADADENAKLAAEAEQKENAPENAGKKAGLFGFRY